MLPRSGEAGYISLNKVPRGSWPSAVRIRRAAQEHPLIMSSHAAPLPSVQHLFEGLPELSEQVLHDRREGVFLLFAGLFLGSLTMLNILGITRFLNLAFFIEGSNEWKFKLAIAVGVLPYPVTFLCTDFISELYGRRRANLVVLVGLMLNVWVVIVLWVGGKWPGFTPDFSPNGGETFYDVQGLAMKAVLASMIAYLAAQFIDVQLFHFWKRVTKGKHLWLRNNASTLVSQLVDSVAVIFITFWADLQSGNKTLTVLWVMVATGYVFKMVAALLDTVPFYFGVRWLTRFLRLQPPTDTDGSTAGGEVRPTK